MAYSSIRAVPDAHNITPSDTAIITAMGFYVGSAGNVAVMPQSQEVSVNPTPVIFYNCPAGFLFKDIAISRVRATNTTASNIVVFGPNYSVTRK